MRRLFLKRFLPVLFWFCLLLAALYVYRAIMPRVQGEYLVIDGVKKELSMPLRILAGGSHLTFAIALHTDTYFPHRYVFSPNACMGRVIVNGNAYEMPPCSETTTRALELLSLHPGKNDLIVQIVQDQPQYLHLFHIQPSARDPLILLSWALLLFSIVGLYGVLMRFLPKWSMGMHGMFLGGILLRALYTLHTHFSERGPDWFGHLEYIRYVLTHGTMPPWDMGWEAYQPPLYYFGSALWVKIADLFLPLHEATSTLQILSFLLSILTLFFALQVGRQLFLRNRDLLLYGSIVTFFPGFVFTASRINNDTLATLAMFSVLWLLLRFFENGSRKYFLLACVVTALGILTKMNAALLIPLVGSVLLLQQKIHVREKIELGLQGIVILIFLAGWYVLLRFFFEGTELVGNADYLHETIRLPNSFTHILAFRPWKILLDPMIQTLGMTMKANAFLEYYFRSALGGYPMPYSSFSILVPIYLLGFVMIPLGIGGVIKYTRDRSTLPILLTLIIFLSLHVVFRLSYPFTSSQDYRYTPLLLIPFAYYVIRGAHHAGHLEKFALGLLWLFVGFSIALPVSFMFAY
ncbi:MAG TPA: glycosyltransferase family 39 protein [Candidatus Peribacteraceae bacterium]|nr:glycosyltransferase family 39 protein [Candidatus Peribacteraceae bacterium]